MADEKLTSRRDFLRGRAAARAVLASVDRIADAAAGIGVSNAATRLRATRRLMACDFVVEYFAADGSAAAAAAIEAFDLIEDLEAQLSVYRPDSEVSLINHSAATAPMVVEERLFELFVRARELHEATGGAFDVTGGPLSRAWGFHERRGRLPAADELADALDRVGLQHVALYEATRSIAFHKPGMEINLGAIGKGYALDRAGELLAEAGVGDCLCHGGASSVLARGNDRGGAEGWRIALPHPRRAGATLGDIVVRDDALGTTGSGVQFFEADGRQFGHVLDPRTGWPAEGVLTATVVAKSAADADALSTALYVLGPGGAAEFCATHAEFGALLVAPRDGSESAVDVHAFNLTADQWRPSAGAQ